jgi:hypothetical protein
VPQPQPFCSKFGGQIDHTGEIAARPRSQQAW